MAKDKKIYLTPKALDEFKKEYETLLKTRRPSAVNRVAETRVVGNFDENNEYVQAKQDLELIDERMAELEQILNNSALIGKTGVDFVALGSTVVIETDDGIEEFAIVGTIEADPSQHKISDESPIGKALLGRKVGETVVVKAAIVNHSCKIIKIK